MFAKSADPETMEEVQALLEDSVKGKCSVSLWQVDQKFLIQL